MGTRTDRGNAAESRALAHLQANGLRLRHRNWRCRHGELDLVMVAGDTLVFVEVRYRGRSDYGGAARSIDRHKRRRVIRSAAAYLQRFRLQDQPARFDVVALGPGTRIDWLPAAFDAD